MNSVVDDILTHYGMPFRSGRYPWGSGKMPFQRSGDFLSRVDEFKAEKLSEKQVADKMGLTIKQLRVQESLAKEERRTLLVARARSLRSDGHSLNEIAKIMGYKNDSSVRSLLDEKAESRMNQAKLTADILKKEIDKKGMIDVGVGVEKELNISREKLDQALYILELQGYPTYGGRVPQITNPQQKTTQKVIGPPGTEHKDIYNFENVHRYSGPISYDGGDTFQPPFIYPTSMNSNRIQVNYAEDGGSRKDGLIEIRRNVEDLSLGKSRYAQVRILVDGTHYMKGMAVHSDNLPDGVDIRFNTNKNRTESKHDAFKPITNDPNNPFGSLIKERGGQSFYTDRSGKQRLSLINKRAEEGDWGDWDDKLSSQVLAKQNVSLITKQLNLTKSEKTMEFEEIRGLTNPTVKKKLLQSFSDDCDAAAVHLKAAALPRQKYQVLIPIPGLKDNEIYAPNYRNGEQVALIRYPHGGTFEIPIVRVNNKHAGASRVLGRTPSDAIGINHNVATRMSGADFDGDAALVIPVNDRIKISTRPALFENFDARMEYPSRAGMRVMTKGGTQAEMGKISNLITDMTLRGATESELARAVKHSMVVIDAEKHSLDYKRSEQDNNIRALKRKYQGRENAGAATLISRAKSEQSVDKRQGSPLINIKGERWYDPKQPEGALLFNTKRDGTPKIVRDATYINKQGKEVTRQQRSTLMAETPDAHTLSSGTPQEKIYAGYANKMKALANQARKEMVMTGNIRYSPTANRTYAPEVASLRAQLNIAEKNAPRERQAQRIANINVAAKRQSDPSLSKEELRKISNQALIAARVSVGAKRYSISISDREWEAVQAGAVSESVLNRMLKHVDLDKLREKATPRTTTTLTPAKIARINAMRASGYTVDEIANALNISRSSVSSQLS